MSLVNDQIRALAERIAHSQGLDLVDIEFHGGGGKHRTLRIFLERNAAGRAELAERLARLDSNERADTAPEGAITLDWVDAGETAGLDPEEDELAYLRELPQGVPAAQLSGITHGDCERFSRDFGTALDVEDMVPGTEYLLEVSSPGLDRRLTRLEEFLRFAGQLCKVQTFTPIDGNRHWLGRIGPVEDGVLSLVPEGGPSGRKKGSKAAAATSAAVSIALTNIEKAQLVPEF